MERLVIHINDFLIRLGFAPETADRADNFIAFLIIVALALLANTFCREFILRGIEKLVKTTKATWDDILFDRKVMIHLSRLVAPIIIYLLIPMVFREQTETLDFIQRICKIAMVIIFLSFLNAMFVAIYTLYSSMERYRERSLKIFLQTFQILLVFIGGIYVVSFLIGQSPIVLLTGLGAAATILMLIFKDSIVGFVAGIQLSANDMLRVGDWITMPKYGADGDVIEVTLNTVKVQNWDKTITTIPPYALISDSFQNWRGMHASGGRRVKRSINIDMNSVRFCTPEMLEKYQKIQLLSDYIESTKRIIEVYNKENHIDNSILVNGRRQTNLGVFRAYLTNYLKNLPTVNQKMMCMVRQLQPTEQGIPLELYFFSDGTNWVFYEGVQADVFDHVLAIIGEFDLRVFQSPSGADFRLLADAASHKEN